MSKARDRLSTGWRPDKGTGKHQRQSRAPGVVQALNRQQEALQAHRIDVPKPPPTLRWPDLGVRQGAPQVRAQGVAVDGRLAGPVDLTIDGGDRLLVTGANGAGKSTLLAVLAGALEPTDGYAWTARGPGSPGSPRRPPGRPPTSPPDEVYARQVGRLVSTRGAARRRAVPLGCARAAGLRRDAYARRADVAGPAAPSRPGAACWPGGPPDPARRADQPPVVDRSSTS